MRVWRWVFLGVLFAAFILRINAFKLGRSRPTERISGGIWFYYEFLFFLFFTFSIFCWLLWSSKFDVLFCRVCQYVCNGVPNLVLKHMFATIFRFITLGFPSQSIKFDQIQALVLKSVNFVFTFIDGGRELLSVHKKFLHLKIIV